MKRNAFTVVEIMLAVLIVGILTAGAAPRISLALRTARLDNACRRIKADLDWARQTALSKSSAVVVQFVPAAGSYSIVGAKNLDRSTPGYTVSLTDAPLKCTINSAALGGDANIVFDQYGQPDSGGTIVVGAGGSVRTVTIDAATGRVTFS